MIIFDTLPKRKKAISKELLSSIGPQVNYHVITTHGGQGSGNFGHAGRAGEVGGSGGGGTGREVSKKEKELINKIGKAEDSGKKTKIFEKANLTKEEAQHLVRNMVLTVPKGHYKLHGREYGTNLVDTIYNMYGWMPSMHVSESMLLGLQATHPEKVYASFTHGLDAIQIK